MTRRSINKMVLLFSARCCAILCLSCALDPPAVFGNSHLPSNSSALTDFVSFWATSRLLIDGGNPFSPVEVLELQRALGFNDANPLLIWHPPWTLSFLLPFGAMPFQFSQFCWLLMHVFFILLSAQ